MASDAIRPWEPPYTPEQLHFARALWMRAEAFAEKRDSPGTLRGDIIQAVIDYDKYRTMEIEELRRQLMQALNCHVRPVVIGSLVGGL